jgi:hypothetical protein
MRSAWKELAKPKYIDQIRAEASSHDFDDPFFYLALDVYDIANRALNNPPWGLKRSEVRDFFANIANTARTFADAVRGTALDCNTERFFPQETLYALLNQFKPFCIDYGLGKTLEATKDNPALAQRFFGEGSSFYEWDGRVERWRKPDGSHDPEDKLIHIPWLSEEGLRSWFCNAFSYRMPRMSVLADAVADQAEQEAHRVAEDPNFMLPKPGDRNARRLYVIRYLAMWFKSMFGGYLRGTLARIANVTLDDPEIGPAQVDEATRNWTPPESPWIKSPYKPRP